MTPYIFSSMACTCSSAEGLARSALHTAALRCAVAGLSSTSVVHIIMSAGSSDPVHFPPVSDGEKFSERRVHTRGSEEPAGFALCRAALRLPAAAQPFFHVYCTHHYVSRCTLAAIARTFLGTSCRTYPGCQCEAAFSVHAHFKGQPCKGLACQWQVLLLTAQVINGFSCQEGSCYHLLLPERS